MPVSESPARGEGRCENVRVRTADGRVFDLGSPESRLFRVRVLIYKLRRRREGMRA